MAFLCSELQVAVETQSQTKPRWHTERRDRRMLLPPSGDMGQNRAIVQEQLTAITAAQPRLMTNTNEGWWRFSPLSIMGNILGNPVKQKAWISELLISDRGRLRPPSVLKR